MCEIILIYRYECFTRKHYYYLRQEVMCSSVSVCLPVCWQDISKIGMHAVYRYRVRNVFILARFKCWRCNKTECSKRGAIFVVYIADFEIFYCRYLVDNCEESCVSCKSESITIDNQRGGIDKNIFAEVGIEYQRQCEKVL